MKFWLVWRGTGIETLLLFQFGTLKVLDPLTNQVMVLSMGSYESLEVLYTLKTVILPLNDLRLFVCDSEL